MKPVNLAAQKILNILTAGLDEEKRYRKVDNAPGSYMYVAVEMLEETAMGKTFSIAHYYVQNGDLMADPEMIVLKSRDDKYYPIYFRMDGFPGTERYSVRIEDDTVKSYYPRQQKDDAVFMGTWMKNIKQQQELKASTVL